MDLRDKFACQAMNGFISGFCTHENTAAIDQLSHNVLAKEAYVVADCMIEARKTSVQGESPATDRQQLKAAIALVRKVGMQFGFGSGVAFAADEFLTGIEQRAAV